MSEEDSRLPGQRLPSFPTKLCDLFSCVSYLNFKCCGFFLYWVVVKIKEWRFINGSYVTVSAMHVSSIIITVYSKYLIVLII